MAGLMAAIFQSPSLADGALAGLKLLFIFRLQIEQRAQKATTSMAPNLFLSLMYP